MAFLRHAIKIAIENVESCEGGPFGAVVVRDNQVVATGVNRVTSMNDPTAHAEMMAVREACRVLGDFQLTGCEVYCSSEPCPMCMGAIYWARAERIYYRLGSTQPPSGSTISLSMMSWLWRSPGAVYRLGECSPRRP